MNMDAILLSVTGLSLAIAAAMGIVLARMLREERRRSEARVALLTELASEPAAAAPVRARTSIVSIPAEPVRAARTAFDDFDLRPSAADEAQASAGVHDLFHDRAEPSAWPRRFAVIGSLAAVVLVVGLALSKLTSSTTQDAAPVAEVAAAQAPLELLSLRHAQDGGILTITGLVQNPRSGAALANVKATLFVFGPGGSFITSARAPLDFTSLGAGDESPFVLRVPVSGEVARYRVGFRGADDRVLAHVDRRTADAIAQK
jgi:hypothetical protein